VALSASASDFDGSVTTVAFYNGSALLGTDTTSPYTFSWNNVPPGDYSLTAIATDDAGATTTSGAGDRSRPWCRRAPRHSVAPQQPSRV